MSSQTSRKIRSVILDIDGTLTEDRNTERLSIEAIQAIRLVLSKCHCVEIGLATGNSHIVAFALARYIGLDLSRCPLISENGCILWYKGQRYELCVEYKHIVDTARELIVRHLSEYVRESYQNEYRRYDYAFYVLPGRSPEEVISKIVSLLEREGLVDKLDVIYSGYAVHILPRGVDKGYAVKLYSRISGIPLQEIAVVGDSDTDLPMFRVAGVRVAVMNASEKLRQSADIVTSEPSGRGVAEFLLNHVLPRCPDICGETER